MHTLHGIRFVPLARVDGTLLGLDARWLGWRGLTLALLLALANPSGPLSRDPDVPVWARLAFGLCSIVAVAFTSFGHEVGHAVAGRLAGLNVRAIVVAPQGGVTIRGSSEHPHVNFRTALAGPLANAVLGTLCLGVASLSTDHVLGLLLIELAAIQLLTAVVNLVPLGRTDGAHIVRAWRAFSLQ